MWLSLKLLFQKNKENKCSERKKIVQVLHMYIFWNSLHTFDDKAGMFWSNTRQEPMKWVVCQLGKIVDIIDVNKNTIKGQNQKVSQHIW